MPKTKGLLDDVRFPMLYSALAAFIGGPFVYGWNINGIGLPGGHIKVFINQSLYDHYGVYDPPDQNTYQNALFSVVNLLLFFGGAIGGFSSSWFSDKFGRKRTLLLTHGLTALATVCYLICTHINSFEVLMVGRLLMGFASGLNFAIAPVYATEITPLSVRGAVGTGSQLFITLGLFFSTVFVLYDTLGTADLWPYGLSCMEFFSLLSAGMLLMPAAVESPKWLMAVKEDEKAARKALQILYQREDVEDILELSRLEARQHSHENAWTFKRLFTTKELRWPLILVVTMNAAQQLSGVNAVFFYANSMYAQAGLNEQEASYAALAITGVNVVATLLAVSLMEHLGRRTLMIYPMAVMCVALIAQVVLLTVNKDYDLGEAEVALSYVAITAVGIYIVAFAVGLGPIPNFSAAELFSSGPRATAAAVGTVANLGGTVIVGILFENVLQPYIDTYSFLPFAAVVAVADVFFWFKLPETKNRSVAEIYQDIGCYEDPRSRNISVIENPTRPIALSPAPIISRSPSFYEPDFYDPDSHLNLD